MLRAGLLLISLLALSPQALAACTASTVAASFGPVTSFALNSTEQTTTGQLIVQCDRVLGLLTNDSITVSMTTASSSASNRAAMKRTDNLTVTDLIPIRVCGQSGCNNNSEVTINATPYTWNASALLGLLGSQRYTLPIYLRTVAGQNVSAGPYQVTLNLSVSYNVCALGAVGLCGTPQTGTLATTLQVNGTVTNDCSTITAPAVNFGSSPLVQNFPTISQAVTLTCTKGSTYTVGLNNGLYPTGTVRNMASGNNRLSYEIYKGNTTSRWGSTGSERWASSASSLISGDALTRTFNYTAKVLTTQATPPGGTYEDTVIMDVAF